MAIKGKRKPQKRGRPAPAPRPRPAAARTAAGGTRVPFYRTFRGQLATIAVVLALIGAGIWFFSDRRADAEKLSQRQDELDSYTREVRGVLDGSKEAIQQLAGVPGDAAADPVHNGYLAKSSKEWVKALQTSGAAVSPLGVPKGMQPATSVFMEAFQVYTSSARAFGNAAEFGGDDASEMQERSDITQGFLDRAVEQRDAANRLIIAAIQMLDEARAEVEMRASELQAPGSLPPIPPPDETSGADQGTKKDGSNKKKEADE